MEDAMVDCLIDNNTSKWDTEMLKGVLIPAEAELAQRIPLPQCQTEDALYWSFTADGQYNCKTGYSFSRIWRKIQRMALTQRWTRIFGKAFGP